MDYKYVRGFSFACLVLFLASMAGCVGPSKIAQPTGTPTVALSTSSIYFGNVAVNATATAQVSLKNSGTADLIIRSISPSSSRNGPKIA